jgi:mono/diheme cytochrome c family protein
MEHTRLLFLVALSITLLLVTACSAQTADAIVGESAAEEYMDNDEHDTDENGMAHGHVQAPEEFAELINTFAEDHEAIDAGEATFNTLCATCHGAEGKGDGPAAAELDPKPADLSDGIMMSDLSDGYLFWRVSKGGAMEPFNSAMPAWESGLTEEQRWQVISYIRTFSEHQAGMEEMDDGHTDDEHDE